LLLRERVSRRGGGAVLGPEVEFGSVKAGELAAARATDQPRGSAVDLIAERAEGPVGAVVLADLEPGYSRSAGRSSPGGAAIR
jgi:hypothetical protein